MTRDKYGVLPFDCDACRNPDRVPHYRNRETRRSWHCGYMEPEEWTECRIPASLGTRPIVFNDESGKKLADREIICPGWLVRQPEVEEAARACSARKDGVLDLYFPNQEHAVLEAAEWMAASISEYEAEELRKMKSG